MLALLHVYLVNYISSGTSRFCDILVLKQDVKSTLIEAKTTCFRHKVEESKDTTMTIPIGQEYDRKRQKLQFL